MMHTVRRTPDEQFRMVLECRKSGMTDRDWCLKEGIRPHTFYTWVSRLRKKGCYEIPESTAGMPRPHQEIVKIDVLPEGSPDPPPNRRDPGGTDPDPAAMASIEIQADGVIFRFSGKIEPSLYEKTLLMIGGRL